MALRCLDGSDFPEGPAEALGASPRAGIWFCSIGGIHMTTGAPEGPRARWIDPIQKQPCSAAVTDWPFPRLDLGLTYLDGRKVL